MKDENYNDGCDILTVLLIAFVVLKLTNLITWSWWWVLSPLWIPLGLVVVCVVLVSIFDKIFD